MTDKAYIVANEQQEMSVLEKLESEGYRWFGNEEPTEWVPSRDDICFGKFPLALISHKNKYVLKNLMQDNFELNILERCEVAFDGRKESKMNISKEVYDALVEWQGDGGGTDANNRLIAIIRWVNGEDVFEVEKPKKWVVRSKSPSGSGNYWYVLAREHNITDWALNKDSATKFDTKEEAQSWANSHQEVVEVNNG